ncbi:MAG: 6,7-dimethyl-8-ribityllumazine synthase [Ectothiorhodospiraceae bacterium]|nr:6,7-dimethyl-8-ribityllumazine synthase [Chromatiales bacterium]MCP5156936.1 6,7-dimethyl-8-ribityllumazine synthase [Ectothiorhodospiraceae bacterium]
MARYDIEHSEYEGAGRRFAIVAARFNADIVDRLLEGALACLGEHGVASTDVDVVRVPGAFEIPLAAQRLAATGGYDAVVGLGTVIRGETPHFDYVCNECARGVAAVSLQHDLPVIFGVLTTDDHAQALARAGGAHGHKGREAALAALEMVTVLGRLASR